MRALRAGFGKCYSVEVEMGLAALILLAWQLSRIPLEGGVGTSLAHARAVLGLEERLGVDVEETLIPLGSSSQVGGLLHWAYGEIHIPALFAFLATARLIAPERYPRLRTILLLSFIPAVLVIGLYPLAPPNWLTELGLGPAPTQAELSGTVARFFENSTAAAASQHFGFAVFIAAGSLWLAPRSPIALATLFYPVVVFVVIVGTGNHYVFDCVVGTLAFALAAAAAWVIHGGTRRRDPVVGLPRSAVPIALGFTMIAFGIEALEAVGLADWRAVIPDGIVLVIGVAGVVAPRLKEARRRGARCLRDGSESGPQPMR